MRLVATDLDGTIVQRDGSVSPRTVAALAAVEASGRHLVLVTGRPPRWMAPVVQATGHRGVAVCGNLGASTQGELDTWWQAARSGQECTPAKKK